MSTPQLAWRATPNDSVRIGEASRPPLLGAALKRSAAEDRRVQVEMLDRNGPKQMSDREYACVQMLLKTAKARLAGSAKGIRKEKEEDCASELRQSIELLPRANLSCASLSDKP